MKVVPFIGFVLFMECQSRQRHENTISQSYYMSCSTKHRTHGRNFKDTFLLLLLAGLMQTSLSANVSTGHLHCISHLCCTLFRATGASCLARNGSVWGPSTGTVSYKRSSLCIAALVDHQIRNNADLGYT